MSDCKHEIDVEICPVNICGGFSEGHYEDARIRFKAEECPRCIRKEMQDD